MTNPRPTPYQPPSYNPPPPPKKKHTGRNILLAVVAVIIVIAAISSATGGSSDKKNSPGGGNTSASQAPAPGISQGIGSQDASKDVTLGKSAHTDQFGFTTISVKIHNPGSKRSDYDVELALQSPDGKTQYDTTDVFAQNVEPGQTTTQQAQFTNKAPKTAVVKIQEVQRTASF